MAISPHLLISGSIWVTVKEDKGSNGASFSKTLASQFGYFAPLSTGVSLTGQMSKIKVISKRENVSKVAENALNYLCKSLDQHSSNIVLGFIITTA